MKSLPLLSLALLFPIAGTVHADSPTTETVAYRIPIFHVAKNTNRNEVHFEANLTDNCAFVDPHPVSVFWRRFEEGPDAVRELKWVEEKFAYGIRYGTRTTDHVTFMIAADESRPVSLWAERRADNCTVRAEVDLLDRPVQPDHVFTEIKPRRLLFPKIIHVDLKGVDADGSKICERVQSAGETGEPCPVPSFQLPPTDSTLLK